MAEIRIHGGQRLKGELRVQGSKNAVLPILAAAIIHPGITVLDNVPHIADVESSLTILRHLDAKIHFRNHRLIIDASDIKSREIPQTLGERTRSSVLFLGALLARFGEASLFSPGGCSIGSRPIDLHLQGLRRMGAAITESDSRIHACISSPDCCKSNINGRLRAADISLACPSVGATEQLLLAASTADGDTIIRGCAREPEIDILCHYLMHIGAAHIRGIGSQILTVHPLHNHSDPCHSTPFLIPGDRIVAATYMGAAAITGGEIYISGISPDSLRTPLACFNQMGCHISLGNNWIKLRAPRHLKAIPYLETSPYPGFPTDMQSIFLTLNAVSSGQGCIREKIFENRLLMAKELNHMGARIRVSGNTAYYTGVRQLHGCRVHATDLRSGAGLILAALAADGETTISGYEYVLRGYEQLDKKLRHMGAAI